MEAYCRVDYSKASGIPHPVTLRRLKIDCGWDFTSTGIMKFQKNCNFLEMLIWVNNIHNQFLVKLLIKGSLFNRNGGPTFVDISKDNIFINYLPRCTYHLLYKKGKSVCHSAHLLSPKISIFSDKRFSYCYKLALHWRHSTLIMCHRVLWKGKGVTRWKHKLHPAPK